MGRMWREKETVRSGSLSWFTQRSASGWPTLGSSASTASRQLTERSATRPQRMTSYITSPFRFVGEDERDRSSTGVRSRQARRGERFDQACVRSGETSDGDLLELT